MKPATTRIPVVCDLSGAPDTPAERVEAYRRLFTDALVARERTLAGIRFRFRNDPGIETRVRDIATLEQQCCAFFSFATTTTGGEVLLDVSSKDQPVNPPATTDSVPPRICPRHAQHSSGSIERENTA